MIYLINWSSFSHFFYIIVGEKRNISLWITKIWKKFNALRHVIAMLSFELYYSHELLVCGEVNYVNYPYGYNVAYQLVIVNQCLALTKINQTLGWMFFKGLKISRDYNYTIIVYSVKNKKMKEIGFCRKEVESWKCIQFICREPFL